MRGMRRALVFVLGLVCAGCQTSPGISPDVPSRVITDPAGNDRLLVEQLEDPDQRASARAALTARGAEVVPLLIEQATTNDPHFRWEIASLLGTIGDSRGFSTVLGFVLNDTHPHVRWRSLWAASRLASSSEVIAAIRPSLTVNDDFVRWNAALALSFFESPEGVSVLHAGVRHPDPFRRWEAINALGRVHDESTLAVLRAAIQSPSVRDRSEVALSLGGIGGEEAIRLLVEALDDEAADVRWRAALSLSRIGTIENLRSLQRLAEEDPDSTVREQAAKAATRLEEKVERAGGAANRELF